FLVPLRSTPASTIVPYTTLFRSVQIVNNNNGARLETYVIAGERGSRVICLNGAAARLVQPGDTVIIISYAMLSEEELRDFKPKVDRKSTRLNSSHVKISYAVFCL